MYFCHTSLHRLYGLKNIMPYIFMFIFFLCAAELSEDKLPLVFSYATAAATLICSPASLFPFRSLI